MKKIFIFMAACLETGFIAGILWENRREKNKIMDKNRNIDNLQRNQRFLLAWLKLQGRSDMFDAYFKWYGAGNIAVYGNGQIGKCFIRELADTKVKVQYIIDRNAKYMDSEIPIYSLEEDLPKVDAIVIAVMNQSDSIAEEIERKCGYSVISIEDVIDGSSMY